MTKEFLVRENGEKALVKMSFEELHERFFKSVQKETWSMIKRYSFLAKDQVEQQYTIELWEAYERYDISKNVCISTYIYWRFERARADLLQPSIGSKKAKFEKEKINSLDVEIDGASSSSFANQQFSNDDTYDKMQQIQPDNHALESELFEIIYSYLKDDEERDLVNVLIDKKEYSVADYAEKWGISRMGANKRLNKLREKLATLLTKEWM